MNPPYCLVVDVWEGNQGLDAPTLRANGVKGMIVRLNSMSGGLHMDDRFAQDWALALTFDAQALYFVYNPWVSGQANYDWLEAHIPADYGARRIFADVEVKYPGYPAATYGAEVEKFKRLVRDDHPLTIYSGGGYLDILTPWPTDVDYWWAGYPSALDNCESWDSYRQILERFDFATATRLCPGKAKMWQCSGDSVDNLPGFGGHAVDVSVFPGTETELKQWFGVSGGTTTMTDWTQKAIGYVAETATWTPGIFKFIVGYAGGNWTKRASDGHMVLEPNEQLKPIEEKARKEGLPLFMLWDFDVADYSNNQIDADPDKWPSVETDYTLQSLIHALEARDFDGLIIRVMNREGFNKHQEQMRYVAFAANKFIERANKWLYTTKGLKKQTLVMTSDAFVRQPPDNAQELFYSWIKADFPPLVVEQQTTALSGNAYPASADAPGAVGNASWKMWAYWWAVKDKLSWVDRNAGLMLYNGDDKALAAWLQIGTVEPPPPPPPPPADDEYVTRAEFEATMEQINGVLKHIVDHLKAI